MGGVEEVLGDEEGDGGRVGGAGQVDQVVDGVCTLLGGGSEDGHHPALGLGAAVAAVTAADFSGHGGGPDSLLGPPRGGVDGWVGQEGEQGRKIVVEVLDQLAALVVGLGLLGQQFDTFAQIFDDPDPFGLVGFSSRQRFAQNVADLSRCAPGPGGQIADQLVSSAA